MAALLLALFDAEVGVIGPVENGRSVLLSWC